MAAERPEIETLSVAEIAAMRPSQGRLLVEEDIERFEAVVLPELLNLPRAKDISLVICGIDLDWVDLNRITGALSQNGLIMQSRYGGARHFDLLARVA